MAAKEVKFNTDARERMLNPGRRVSSRRSSFEPPEGAGEEFAKLVNAGAASWAKRWAANFEWRMVDLCKILSSPEIAVGADRAEIE